METFGVAEVASLLHLNPKRVQRLARTGQLPAVRVGRRWLFPRDRMEALLSRGSESGGAASAARAPAVAGVVALSARNQLRTRIVSVRADGVMAEVRLQLGEQELVAVITRESVDRLGLAPGDEVVAVIKSTEIMIGRV
jgi:molybdopterin-binding protein